MNGHGGKRAGAGRKPGSKSQSHEALCVLALAIAKTALDQMAALIEDMNRASVVDRD